MNLKLEILLSEKLDNMSTIELIENLQLHMDSKFEHKKDSIIAHFIDEEDPDLILKSTFARLIKNDAPSGLEINIYLDLDDSYESFPILFDYVLINYFSKFKTNMKIGRKLLK